MRPHCYCQNMDCHHKQARQWTGKMKCPGTAQEVRQNSPSTDLFHVSFAEVFPPNFLYQELSHSIDVRRALLQKHLVGGGTVQWIFETNQKQPLRCCATSELCLWLIGICFPSPSSFTSSASSFSHRMYYLCDDKIAFTFFKVLNNEKLIKPKPT